MTKRILYILVLVLIVSSCTSEFIETNTNPNNPEDAPLTNVFAYTIEELASLNGGTTEMKYPGAFVGYITKGTYTDVINYNTDPGDGIWNGIYNTVLSNINYVIDGAKADNLPNLTAAAMVIKAYSLQLAVDIYGKVPYSEAGQASSGLIHPSYENEKEIYYSLFSYLDEANSLFDATHGGNIGAGDLLYADDIDLWQKFCNSLHLRMAIRLSNVDSDKAKEEITKILSNTTTYPIFESNTDNALLTFPGGDWLEPWSSEHSSIGDDYIAQPIVDTLLSFNDPRIAYYAEPTTNGSYIGLTVGDDADIEYSRVNDRFVNNITGSIYFLKYAEVELIKAEAIQKGYVTGNAEEAYQSAITASCKEYNIDDATITSYLSDSKIAWHNNIEQIYIQKWIALFRQSWEAWAEMRRTDIPALTPATHSPYSGHTRTPFRFPYPDSEKKLNSGNIPENVPEKDYFWGYQVWWDTRTGVQ